jgi:hypothetical protein
VLQLSFIAAPVAVIIIIPQFCHQEGDGQIVILKQVQDDEGVCSG